jgi:Holliday junction resolvase RusA-like endonuclease
MITPQPARDQDRELAVAYLRAILAHTPGRVVYFVHHGPPVAKERARKGKGRHHYTPAKTRLAERDLAWRWGGALGGFRFPGAVAVVAVFYLPTRRRWDADNGMKLLLDAGTKAGAWADDCQVTTQAAFVALDRERPRTVVIAADTVSTMWPLDSGGEASR